MAKDRKYSWRYNENGCDHMPPRSLNNYRYLQPFGNCHSLPANLLVVPSLFKVSRGTAYVLVAKVGVSEAILFHHVTWYVDTSWNSEFAWRCLLRLLNTPKSVFRHLFSPTTQPLHVDEAIRAVGLSALMVSKQVWAVLYKYTVDQYSLVVDWLVIWLIGLIFDISN